jgi:hypothetical protein
VVVAQALVFALGAVGVIRVVLSAVRTFVVPRGDNDALTRIAFRATRRVFDRIASPNRPYAARDRIMAYYGPISLVLLPVWWLIILAISFAAMFWAIGVDANEAVLVSGSSLLTLGFERPPVAGGELLAFAEAAIGLALVALLISYLPTIYSAFQRRELLVRLLEVRADTPPSPIVMLTRIDRLAGLDVLHDTWERWEQWFAELEETHTSIPVLVFYRSQQPEMSWVNASGAMMDAAALVRSAVAIPVDAQADLMIRAGYLALRRIAAVFEIRFDPNPSPTQTTSIDRARFDEALEVLDQAGVPLVDDRDRAWRDFNGWRVNYDAALRGLERLTMAPTPWWERPIRSAWATDEPETVGAVDVTAADAAASDVDGAVSDVNGTGTLVATATEPTGR